MSHPQSEPFLDDQPYSIQNDRQPRKYCCGKLTRGWFYLAVAAIIAIILVIAIVLLIFVYGRHVAQQQLNDSEISIRMTISDFTPTSFSAHVVGTIDNRGTNTATLRSTTITLHYEGGDFGSMKFPEIVAQGGAITPLDVRSTVVVGNSGVFDQFGRDLLHKDRLVVRMSAKITAKALGITYTNLDFNKNVVLEGFSDFSNPAPEIIYQSVDNGMEDTVQMSLQVALVNTASVAFGDVGRLNFSLFYQNEDLGYSIADTPVVLGFGTTMVNLTAYVTRTQANEPLIDEILSSYTSGNSVMLEMRGNPYSTSVPLLRNSMATLRSKVLFRGLVNNQDKLFANVYQFLNVSDMLIPDPVACPYTATHRKQPVHVYAHNPLNVVMYLDEVNMNITWEGAPQFGMKPMYFANARNNNVSLVIPPQGTVVFTQNLCLSDDPAVVGALAKYVFAVKADGNGVTPFVMFVTVNGQMMGRAGGFTRANLEYLQEHVLVVTRILLPH